MKFGDNRNCNNGGMLLISHVTSRDRTFKVSWNFICGRPSWLVSTVPYLVALGPIQVDTKNT